MSPRPVLILSCAAFLATVVSTGALASDSKRLEARPSYFGLNGTKMFHIPEQIDGLVSKRFGWMKELGVSWDRIDLWWHTAEPKRGVWDFSRPDACFDAYERNGVQWYPILCYGSAWFEQGRNTPKSDQDYADFVEYVSRTVSRYRGRAPYWSLWNEPNILPFWAPQPDVEAYAKLMRLAYPAFKKADPRAKLCAPVIAPLGKWDRTFVERMYQAGAKDYFDVFDYHYYRHHAPEAEVPAEIAEIQAVKRRYGDAEKPIWISEAGVTSLLNGRPGPESRQAAYIVRNHLLCLALGVQKFFYFDLQNWYDDRPETWDTQLGLVTASGVKKKSFDAYRTMVQQCDGKRFVGRIVRLERNVQGVLIHDPVAKRLTLAAWSTLPGGAIQLPVALAQQTGVLVDPYGKRRVLNGAKDADRWSAQVQVGENPVFIQGVRPESYLVEAGAKLAPAMLIVAPGDRSTMRIVADPLMTQVKVEALTVRAPKGIDWNPSSGSLRVLEGCPPDTVTVSGRFRVSGMVQGVRVDGIVERDARVEVAPKLTVGFRPTLESGRLVAQVRVANESSRPVSERLKLASKTVATSPRSQLRVAPMSNQVQTIAIPESMLRGLRSNDEWLLSYGSHRAKAFRVYPMRLSPTQPKIDGDLSDWKAVPTIDIDRLSQITRNPSGWSPADASAQCQAWATNRAFFFAARVRDDDPLVNTEPPAMIWKGDSFEVYLGVRGPTARTVIDKSCEFQLGLAPTYAEGKPLAFWFHKDVVLDSAVVSSRRVSGGWVIEARIPWSTLGVGTAAFRDGTLIGFDVKLNDLDRGDLAPAGNLPGRDLVWNGTGANWIDPSGWGLAVLRGDR